MPARGTSHAARRAAFLRAPFRLAWTEMGGLAVRDVLSKHGLIISRPITYVNIYITSFACRLWDIYDDREPICHIYLTKPTAFLRDLTNVTFWVTMGL